MTLYRLALKNVQTQFRSYLMYFSSMAFCVMVFYSFIAMATDRTLVDRAGDDLRVASAMKSASLIIVLFIMVFMHTANSYFVRRRKREIGLYNLLGMRKRQISLLFFLENILLGCASLILGLTLGILLSKFFSMILYKVIYLNAESDFTLSIEGFFYTVGIFLVILLFVVVKSGTTVYRYKLIDLFKSESRGDRVLKVTPLTVILGISGIAMISCGYYFATDFIDVLKKFMEIVQHNQMGVLHLLIFILVLCITGTFLFFRSGLELLIVVAQKIKTYYYKNLNMVTIGNLRFHLQKNATTLALIAILCGAAIAAIGGAVAVYSYNIDSVEASIPASYVAAEESSAALLAAVEAAGGKVKSQQTVHYKITEMSGQILHFGENEVDEFSQKVNAMAYSDYQKLTKIYKKMPEVRLDNQEMIILGSFKGAQTGFNDLAKKVRILGLDEPLRLQAVSDFAPSGGVIDYGLVKIVVPDAIYEKISNVGQYSLNLINVAGADEDAILNQQVAELYPADFLAPISIIWGDDVVLGEVDDTNVLSRVNYVDRYSDLNSYRKIFGVLVYAAMFIGIVLLVATGSIIMLKQLGEAEDERHRYQILRKLGVQKNKIRSSIYRQNLFVFLAPMLLALTHAWFANRILTVIFPIKNYFLPIMTCGALLVIYLIFYLWTAHLYNKTVNE